MSNIGYIASPMSRLQIRDVTVRIRTAFGLCDKPNFPVLHALENILPEMIPEAVFEVVDPDEMPGMYAEAFPAATSIRVRQDVYNGARAGIPRDRFTLAHELGHLVLHAEHRLQRTASLMHVKAFQDPEWQANAFAGELLMPLDIYKRLRNPEDACTVFGVSKAALEVQRSAWSKERLL